MTDEPAYLEVIDLDDFMRHPGIAGFVVHTADRIVERLQLDGDQHAALVEDLLVVFARAVATTAEATGLVEVVDGRKTHWLSDGGYA